MAPDYLLSTPQLDDPYPYYRELRNDDPAHFSPTEDLYVITRFEDCMSVFSDWQSFSSERRGNLVNDPPERIGKTLGTTDPPRHTLARRLVSKAFTPRRVAELEGAVTAHARALAAEATASGRFEFVGAIAAPLTAGVLGRLFGMGEEEVLEMRPALDDFFTREPAEPGAPPPHAVAMAKLRRFLDGVVAGRSDRPGADLVSAMLAAEDEGSRLDREQVVVTTMTFLTAGFESANNLLTNMAGALAVVPGLFEEMSARPELMPAFVEEAMRYDAAAQGFVRTPTRPVELHGRIIPEGAQVLVHIGSANRDEREFEAPDEFRLGRPTRRHLGLGHGPHFCIGAPLGRLVARASFSELVASARRFDADLAGGRRVTTPNFRGYSYLEVETG